LSHRGPLRGNRHRSLYIKTLCEAMVIDFLCHIEALCEAMVIDLLTSRPFVRQWSSISLNQDPLRGNGHWFLLSDDNPLHGNGHHFFRYRPTPQDWSNIFFFKKVKIQKEFGFRIGTLYMVMVVESFRYRPSPQDWSNLFFSKSQNTKRIWFFGLDPLHGNGHRIL